MGIIARQNGEARKPVPAGNYFGVCVGVYDIGTQPGNKFGPKHQVILQFELHRKKGPARDEAGKPLLISKFYNLAFADKSTLRHDVESILGRSFTEAEAKRGYDISQLLEVDCRLTVHHAAREDGGVRDEIGTFMVCDDEDPKIEPVSDAVVYELTPGKEISDSVPEWVRKKIEACSEWRTAPQARPTAKVGSSGNPQRATAAAIADEDEIAF